MAATMNTKAAFSVRACAPKARRVVRVEASAKGVEKVLLSAAAFATAAVLAMPAEAGVILVQPKLKKEFQEESTPFVRTEAGISRVAATKAAPRVETVESSGGGFLDARTLALPGSIGFIGALVFAASALDGEFSTFIDKAMLKNNEQDGVGYEGVIKSTYGGIYGEVTASGTKKVKKSALSFFGKK